MLRVGVTQYMEHTHLVSTKSNFVISAGYNEFSYIRFLFFTKFSVYFFKKHPWLTNSKNLIVFQNLLYNSWKLILQENKSKELAQGYFLKGNKL